MWALDVLKLTLKLPAALGFFNNPATLLLQLDVLTYTALDAHCLLLLFLAFGCYDFVPKEYNAPGLFPHDLLDAPEIDHLPETLIAAFHNIALMNFLPTDSANKIYPTISQIALPAIIAEKEVEDAKRQMEQVTRVTPTYKLAIRNRIQFEPDPALPPISHEVDDVWIDRITTDQLLRNRTYQGTHYPYLSSTIVSLFQVDGDWFRRLTTCMPLAVLLASPCSPAEYAYVNDLLIPHAQNFDPAMPTAFYNYPQWQALAAALTACHFPPPPPSMLFPEHHWMDYPDALKVEIQRILLPQLTPALVAPQSPAALPPPPVPQPPLPATLLPPMVPMDVQTPQAPSTSTPALHRHGQPI
uniref:Uncharacterized protein n=1 Tax=Romanomermis culicivorax TaxID=13658 RepID=A0A915J2D8_ROMCU